MTSAVQIEGGSMTKLSIRDLDLAHKHVFMRVDFNVPLTEDGSEITDDTRIKETLPTIEYALRHKAKLILASHLGRPKGKVNLKYSLRPVVDRLRTLLDHAPGREDQRGVLRRTAWATLRRSWRGSWNRGRCCCSRICASMPRKRRTIRSLRSSWRRCATCT